MSCENDQVGLFALYQIDSCNFWPQESLGGLALGWVGGWLRWGIWWVVCVASKLFW